MASTPEISVVMPVHNAEAFVEEAVRSILSQTFQDFEFIIIDDGSTDHTGSILDQYQRLDARVQVHHCEQRGLAPALNYGCRRARGRYIARMDADDVSLPHRLERQIKYIESHPEIGILGTWILNVDEHGSTKGMWRPPTNPKTLRWAHFFGVCVSHPTVLMRREVVRRLGFYDTNAVYGVDVDLWLRASFVTEFGNVSEVLHKYRVWGGSMSHVLAASKRESHIAMLASFIRETFKIDPSVKAVAGLRQTRVGPPPEDLTQVQATADLIQMLYQEFTKTNCLTNEERKEISWDAAKRVASLAMHASRFDKLAAAALLLQAMKLNRRLLSPSAVVKGLRRTLQSETKVKSERNKAKVIRNNRLFEN